MIDIEIESVGGAHPTWEKCDTLTGQTWDFYPANEAVPDPVWLQVKRLDTQDAVRQWKQQVNDHGKKQRNLDYNGKPYNQPQSNSAPNPVPNTRY